MNKDVLEGKWRQLRGTIKTKWGKLTDDELDQIEGNYDRLVGKVQERYGYTRDAIEAELNTMMAREEATRKA